MAQYHVIAGAAEGVEYPKIRTIGLADIRDALMRGVDDFKAMPSHVIFLCLIYPIVGFFLAGLTLGYGVLPLFFPLAAGFALIGPVAALGLYELSRRREQGLPADWSHAFDVVRSPSFGAIAALAALLMILFLSWLAIAQSLYQSLFGYLPPETIDGFLRQILTTPEGWTLILWGNAAGALFAAVAFMVGVVSFPLLLDRDVGAAVALMTSVRAVAKNPVPMAAWGLIVAALLFVGALPLFVGLAVVMPILGHATWHLYRRVIV
jgi:uncharacterized membrane protein